MTSPHSVEGYLPRPDARQITAGQTAAIPDTSRSMIRDAVDEFEAGQTAEAICAKDADSLEMLFQAIEYRDISIRRVDGWIESARRGIRTEAGRRIAQAATSVSPSPGETGLHVACTSAYRPQWMVVSVGTTSSASRTRRTA